MSQEKQKILIIDQIRTKGEKLKIIDFPLILLVSVSSRFVQLVSLLLFKHWNLFSFISLLIMSSFC